MANNTDRGFNLAEMVKTINEDADYKVLTKEEYELLLARASEASNRGTQNTSTPKSGEHNTNLKFPPPTSARPKIVNPGAGASPRLSFLQNTLLNNTGNLQNTLLQNAGNFQNTYVPKLPIFSGAEEPQKGEASYEVWSFEVKCLKNSANLPDHILFQSIRNSLRGTARDMLVPLGEHATVDEILEKLDGFFGNVYTSETLMQSFYSDCQKDNESIVIYGSRLEQTLSRAVSFGHIDVVAKDAMLRSKFWTGLKSQTLKNSTRHLYDSVRDFKSLLREIRKVDVEESSTKPPANPKKSAHQLSGQVSTEDTNTQLLKQMSELMGRMKAMEERLDQQSKALAESKKDSSSQQSFSPGGFRGRGRGYGRGSYGGGYGRGYQNDNSQNNNSYRGNRGGRSGRGYRGGSNGRGAYHDDHSAGNTGHLN
ncbi:MAG: hypothetical protein JAZ03_07220 [Candidatus Thiodiazotropha taylori]|nr:hypothetical protein [Candidatus Thiodiazotropha taylori]MCW4333713.1 hypothetical protein [Candidatus Thiodiazotropha endolucinida]